jgi:hypothetical protein
MHRFTSRAALAAIVLVVAACGADPGVVPSPTTDVVGSVYAAPVSGAAVTVRDQAGAVVGGPVATAADGTFRVAVLDSALGGPLRFEARNGTYLDEATGATVTTGLRLAAWRDAPVPLGRAAAPLAAAPALPQPAVHLTPGSTVVHDLMVAGKTRAQAETAFAATFGWVPDLAVAPSPAAAASQAARLAALRAGAFSWLLRSILPGAPAKQALLLAAIAKDLEEGQLDGLDAADAAVAIEAGTTMPTDALYRFATALKACGDHHTALGLASGAVKTDSYAVEWVGGVAGAKMGRSAFQLRVTTAAGAPVSGAAISLVPKMFMSTKNHSAPVDAIAESAVAGTYDAAVYFQMASGPTMGFWEVAVTVNGETACFYPEVAMTMNVLGRLYGVADLIPKLPTGTQKRTYLVFKDALTGMGPHTLKLFVAAPDDAEMMRFPAIGAGATLHDGAGAAWAVDEVVVQASSDAGATWQVATVGPRGHYEVAGLDGLASGGTVRVKVSVNGEAKTDQAGTLDYAPFTIAAPGGM